MVEASMKRGTELSKSSGFEDYENLLVRIRALKGDRVFSAVAGHPSSSRGPEPRLDTVLNMPSEATVHSDYLDGFAQSRSGTRLKFRTVDPRFAKDFLKTRNDIIRDYIRWNGLNFSLSLRLFLDHTFFI